MRNSEIEPRNNGSDSKYCDAPSQLLFVLPRTDGFRVSSLFVPTGSPSMYSVPTRFSPSIVTAK